MNYKVKLNKKETGYNLYRIIETSTYSYSDIADFLGLATTRVIYEWTNGNKLPSVENLINLAKFLNVQIEDILVL